MVEYAMVAFRTPVLRNCSLELKVFRSIDLVAEEESLKSERPNMCSRKNSSRNTRKISIGYYEYARLLIG